MKNWKTTLAGVATIALGVAGLLGIQIGVTPISAEASLGLISTGIGLLFAKDSNVTGGTVQQ